MLQSLARPVANVDSPDEAHVLAIVDHLAPMLDAWREGLDLRAALEEVERDLASNHEQFTAARSMVESLPAGIRKAEEPVSKLGAGVVVAFVGAIVSLFLPNAFKLLALLFLGGGLVAGYFWSRARQEVQSLTKRQADFEKSAAELDSTISDLAARRETLKEELGGRSESFPTVELADVRFPLKLAGISGRNVLLDQSGSYAEVTLRAIDVSGLEDGVADISEKIDRLLSVPPMLSSAAASGAEDPLERLYGEEHELSNLVTDFTESLGLLRNVEVSLPIIPAGSVLAQRVAGGGGMEPAVASAILLTHDAGDTARIDSFVEEVEQNRERAQQVFADLARAHDRLSAGCNLYASARSQSANALHNSWLEVLGRANWCDRRFYCARTIMSPKYLEDLLGIAVAQAFRLSEDDLVERLGNDNSIRQRLDMKPELETQLRSALVGVQEFMDTNDAGDGAPAVSRPRHIEDQYRECLLMFQRTLQKVMTGSSFPVLNFSSEALLHYDPDIEEWSSDLSPHVYRTHEVLRFGSVVKAYSDLMIPLWEHLWTEKSDFRKTETFRTNDQMIRMSEKEAEKLIDVANQFRDDLRSVRENLNNLGADLKSKIGEINNFKDGMDSLGVLSDRARAMIEMSGSALGEDEEAILAQVDRFEIILAGQPQAQMENRGTVQDPIELVRGFDALIIVDSAPRMRLLPA